MLWSQSREWVLEVTGHFYAFTCARAGQREEQSESKSKNLVHWQTEFNSVSSVRTLELKRNLSLSDKLVQLSCRFFRNKKCSFASFFCAFLSLCSLNRSFPIFFQNSSRLFSCIFSPLSSNWYASAYLLLLKKTLKKVCTQPDSNERSFVWKTNVITSTL